MRPKRIVLALLIVGAGVFVGLRIPHWKTITIVFEAGGAAVIDQKPPRRLPATLQIVDDGRLRLRVINRDSVPHAAGVLGLPARDSAIVSAELCTGTHEHGAKTILLR